MLFQSNSRVRFSIAGIGGLNELKRDFHSTPDLTGKLNGVSNGVSTFAPRTHRSQEDIPSKSQSLLPPPNHPPPPPPGQLIKVEIKNGSECDYGSITSSEHSTNGMFPSITFHQHTLKFFYSLIWQALKLYTVWPEILMIMKAGLRQDFMLNLRRTSSPTINKESPSNTGNQITHYFTILF